jgi:hypothetical protein
MERVILSKRNCHRAAVVRNIHNPEWGDWAFHYKAQKLPGMGNYAHVIGTGSNSKVLHADNNMSDYEVVSWKYDVTLDEHWDLAMRAFNWTSFDPERRGSRVIIENEQELNKDLENMPEEEKERYISNYKKYFSAWLSACSNCASSAITGGSGFNTGRAEKANNREHARMEDFIQWREKALKAIAKRREENKPESEKRNEAWGRLERDILSSAATIHGINAGIERGYNRALFVSSIFNKVETYAKRGDAEMVQRAINCIRKFNETMGVVITERHKFFKLLEVAEASREKLSDKSEKESTEVKFKGGKAVSNFQENRIQLIFDEKPSADIISQLKKNGMKWSPRFGAWQRQLTGNAQFAVNYFLKNNNLCL